MLLQERGERGSLVSEKLCAQGRIFIGGEAWSVVGHDPARREAGEAAGGGKILAAGDSVEKSTGEHVPGAIGVYRVDPVFIAGFSLNMVIYVRNLYFIHWPGEDAPSSS